MVASGWRRVQIQSLYDGLYDGPHATPSPSDSGPIFLGIKNITDAGKLDLTDIRHISEEEFPDWTRRIVPQAGDIVFTYEATLNRYAIIPEGFRGCLGRRLALIRPSPEMVNTKFLFYYFFGREWRATVARNIYPGSTVDRIPLSEFPEFEVALPTRAEQDSIAAVLSSLDDKIDLLQRQNKTLEGIAEALFRQWFVEDAEDHWKGCSLYEAIDLVGGGTPRTSEAEYWNGDIYWLAGGDIASNHKSFAVSTEKKITEDGLNNSSAKLLPRFSTVISARGTVGKYCLLSEPMAFSQSNYGIKPSFEDCFFFTYLLIDHSVNALQRAAYGSVFDTITTRTFQNHRVVVPSEAEVHSFEQRVAPYFYRMNLNQKQIRTLQQLRDTLLPKLMSRDIRVRL